MLKHTNVWCIVYSAVVKHTYNIYRLGDGELIAAINWSPKKFNYIGCC